jgi:hypothetical protein
MVKDPRLCSLFMNPWFYARSGQQKGPVSFEQLVNLAHTGELDPEDLVWNASMKNWAPAQTVAGLFDAPPSPLPATATPKSPLSQWESAAEEPNALPGAAEQAAALPEITHGSEPLDIVACIKRGVEMTRRNFVTILIVGLTCFGIMLFASLILGAVDSAMGWKTAPPPGAGDSPFEMVQNRGSAFNNIVSQVLSIFLSLGTTRIGLRLLSGRDVAVGMLFGETDKLLRAIGASILLGAMVFVGLLLFIVPGIYLALRFGHCLTAIVDRNLGVLESLAYSSSITTNNRLQLFGLALLSIAIVIAGALAFLVGLVFAIPVVWLSYLAAYRWMQFGARALQDDPATGTPLLSGI